MLYRPLQHLIVPRVIDVRLLDRCGIEPWGVEPTLKATLRV